MELYKEGSTGTLVKEIQKVVGANPDGVWGPKTTALVKTWQKSHGLTADGIVGPITLAKMGISEKPQAAAQSDGISITKATISTHITRCPGRQPQYIAIHYTAGSTSRSGQALATRNVFLQREASADFVVDDAQIVQVNPDPHNYYCWAVGDKFNKWTGGGRLNGKATNRNTISIEICSTLAKGTSAQQPNHSGWSFTPQALDNARRLVRHLMREYGIPRERVIRHYDATGKLCPGIPGWNDGPLNNTDGKAAGSKSNSVKWQEFWKSI